MNEIPQITQITTLGSASATLPFSAFLLASLVLAATPGPGVIYIVARTLAQGRRAGLASLAGVAFGNLANAIGASIGLAALFAISSLAFTVVKYAGAAYLVYLGVKAVCAVPAPQTAGATFGAACLAPIFRDGFVVALLNPKTALFFAAFLPQFVDPAASALLQTLLLGSLFVLIAVVTDSLYVLSASAIQPALMRRSRLRGVGRYLSAGVLIGLGVLAAVTDTRGGK
ncbi:MAG TPA: LysE family translocator [Accumulibacter sp.]|nr:LysE family translocator [Accumulibacter sp.]